MAVLAGSMMVIAGCAPQGSPNAAKYSVISYEEIIQNSGLPDVYELIQTLRPHFLTERNIVTMDSAGSGGGTGNTGGDQTAPPPGSGFDPSVVAGPGKITVFLDGGKFGLVQSLRVLNPTAIREVRYIKQFAAEVQYGTKGPVIELFSR